MSANWRILDAADPLNFSADPDGAQRPAALSLGLYLLNGEEGGQGPRSVYETLLLRHEEAATEICLAALWRRCGDDHRMQREIENLARMLDGILAAA